MILVDAKCFLAPDRCEDFIREVRKIVSVVRNEDGCHRYELVRDTDHPVIFHFLEMWESEKHLDTHIGQPHMKEYFAKTSPWHSAPTELTIYGIASSRSVIMKE